VYNAIFVKGDLIGENLFYGEGAGGRPTSSAVLSDLVSISRGIAEGIRPQKCAASVKETVRLKRMNEVRTRYYVRFSAIDKPGVLAKISGILAKYKISIANVTQKERKMAKVVPIVMMTHEALERNMTKAIKEIDALSVIKKKSVRIRVEG
jgi:homoserine dehydrogenase